MSDPDGPDPTDRCLLDVAEMMGLHLLDLDPCELRDRANLMLGDYIRTWRPR